MLSYALPLALIATACAAPVRRGVDLGKTFDANRAEHSDVSIPQMMAETGTTRVEGTAAWFWPDAVVPYYFNAAAVRNEPTLRANVEAAMRLVEQKTVVQYIYCGDLFGTKHALCGAYTRRLEVRGFAPTTHCKATFAWGTVANNAATSAIFIGAACINDPGIIVHELFHTLAIYHEHQRFDRDQYVAVSARKANADAANYGHKENVAGATFNLKYDFKSIMHYRLDCARAPQQGCDDSVQLTAGGEARMRTQGVAANEVGRFQRLSPLDTAKINLYYRDAAAKIADDTLCTKVYVGANDLVAPSATPVEAGTCSACAKPATKRGVQEVVTAYYRRYNYTHWACGAVVEATTTATAAATTTRTTATATTTATTRTTTRTTATTTTTSTTTTSTTRTTAATTTTATTRTTTRTTVTATSTATTRTTAATTTTATTRTTAATTTTATATTTTRTTAATTTTTTTTTTTHTTATAATPVAACFSPLAPVYTSWCRANCAVMVKAYPAWCAFE